MWSARSASSFPPSASITSSAKCRQPHHPDRQFPRRPSGNQTKAPARYRRPHGGWCGAVGLAEPHAAGAWTLRARLDLEGHELTTTKSVEVGLRTTPMKEVLLTVVGGNKAEATIGH